MCEISLGILTAQYTLKDLTVIAFIARHGVNNTLLLFVHRCVSLFCSLAEFSILDLRLLRDPYVFQI